MNNIIKPVTMRFDLSSDATLIKVSIKQFTGRTKDAPLSAQAAATNNADVAAIETHLSSFDKQDRTPIQKIATKARDHLNFHSATWDTAGWRMVANTNYENLRSELEAFGLEFMAEVNSLCARHSDLELKARAALGPVLFPRIGFPDAQTLRESFSYAVERQPIVNAGDIRLRHVSAEAVKEIEESTRRHQSEKVEDALKQLMARLSEVVGHMATKLADEDAVFRDTLVTNVRELCAIVPSLNLTADPFISRVADEIASTLAHVQPQVLRTDKAARKEVAKTASKLADKLRTFTPSNAV